MVESFVKDVDCEVKKVESFYLHP